MAYRELLGDNRGFEQSPSGSTSYDEFTVTIQTGCSNGLSTDSGYYSDQSAWLKSYSKSVGIDNVKCTLATDKEVAVPGVLYKASLAIMLVENYRSGSACSMTDTAYVRFYNSTGGLISSSDVIFTHNYSSTSFPSTGWNYYTLTDFEAPANAATMDIYAEVRVYNTESDDPAQEMYRKINLDGFSLKKKYNAGSMGLDLSGYGVT